MDNTQIFNEESFAIDIVSQSKFEKESGIKLDSIKNIAFINESYLKDISVNTQSNGNNNFKRNGIGVIDIANTKTSNTFINSVQENTKKKIEQAKREVENSDIEFPYIKAKLMTDAEIQLYHFMLNNICQIDRIAIFPKVRLADIINVDKRVTIDKNALYKIAYKHVDFLICNKNTLDIICVVELDDYTHETDEAKNRDLFVMQALSTAGIPVARIRCKIKNISASDLYYTDDLINKALAPKCPRCGKNMVPKAARDGHRFYACEDNINCRKTIDIDPRGERLP